MTNQAPTELRKVEVWDLPTRLFHWALLALVLVAWFTGEEEGQAALIHRYAGEAIAGLIVFRVVWGFIGGEHARFADFAAGPSAIIAHLRDMFSRKPKRHLGHNPLGGVAVFLLLAITAAIVVTGLFAGGENNAGPFAGMWGLDLAEAHDVLFRILQALVILHVLGVVVETIKTRDALVPAMITGIKRRASDEKGNDARRSSAVAFLVALLIGAFVSAALIAQPGPDPASSADGSGTAQNSAGDEEAGEQD